jgi:hypothetical protein
MLRLEEEERERQELLRARALGQQLDREEGCIYMPNAHLLPLHNSPPRV